MNATVAAPSLADLRGLPFLDDSFAGRRLLAVTAAARYAAACHRSMADGTRPADAETWLGPARAFALRTSSMPMPAQPLTPARKQQVSRTLADIAAAMPPWQPLLALPVRYARLHPAGGAISASSHAWPQHVLLADEAFATARELAEQAVHELAHQWLYLIEDIWPLQFPGAADITLPSGTRGRSPAEVLGAAHVAAVLARLYRHTKPTRAADRIRALTSYGAACLKLASARSTDLTESGTLIAEQLREAF